MKRNYLIPFLSIAISAVCISGQIAAQTSENREIRNLKAFAKLYGYVRFFHPSDESANMDWDKFAVAGVEDIIKCKNDSELKETLKKWYYPVAPTMQIYNNENEIDTKSISYDRDTTGMDVVAWQHYGVWLGAESNTYRSSRVYSKGNIESGEYQGEITQLNKLPGITKLFQKFPGKNEVFTSVLFENLNCRIPLTLYCDSNGTKGKNRSYSMEFIKEKLAPYDTTGFSSDDKKTRLADIVIAWNVYTHFYPYFSEVKIDWEKVLPEFLVLASENKNGEEFFYTLKKLTARLHDGHAFVSSSKFPEYRLPLKIDLIENQFIITSSYNPELPVGSFVESIDGIPIKKEFDKQFESLSGSEQFSRVNALSYIGSAYERKDAELNVSVNGVRKNVKVRRDFTGWMLEYTYEPIKKLEDGVYLVSVLYTDNEQFGQMLGELKNAKGIIFDLRFNAMPRAGKERISMWDDILWRMIDGDTKSAKWMIPEVIYPDQKDLTFIERGWTMSPYPKYFNCPKVFITDSYNVSHWETFMGIVEYYKLGEIVGAATAGANGNMNSIHLPGGFNAGFTGMKVLKHNGSQHHLIGIQPTYPVQRSIKAVKEGRDEYLEKAIEVLKSKIK